MQFDRVITGILRYMDREIYPKMNNWQEILARIAVTRLVKSSDQFKIFLRDNAFVKTFAIMDDESNVDVDGLISDIREQIRAKGKLEISIPMFGIFSFTESDIAKLHQCIMDVQ